jgi:hypothetical protein
VWTETDGVQLLYGVLVCDGLDLAGWALGIATDVSDNGRTIAEYGWNRDGSLEGWIAVVPEPGTALL